MNLTRICGCPKYPSPHPAQEINIIRFVRLLEDGGRREKKSAPSPANACIVGAGPPKAIAAAIGTYSTVKNIIVPCTKSVSATAPNPPKKV